MAAIDSTVRYQVLVRDRANPNKEIPEAYKERVEKLRHPMIEHWFRARRVFFDIQSDSLVYEYD